MTRSLLVPLLFGVTCASLQASPVPGSSDIRGLVHMTGRIVDTPCALHADNQYQAFTLQPTAIGGLLQGDTNIKQPLKMYINGCTTETNNTNSRAAGFILTLEGEGAEREFAVLGSAKGIALIIKDDQGNPVSPGVPLQDTNVASGNMTLNYSISLTSTGNAIEAGDYHATIKLRINHY